MANDGKASDAKETTVNPEQAALEKIKELSMQARAEAGSSLVTWFSFGRACTEEDYISPWWSEQRDQDLRRFTQLQGNDILQGAIASVVKKFKAMSWVLEGPKADDPDDPLPGTVDYHQRVLMSSEFTQGWGELLAKSLQDYLTQDRGMFWELIGPGDPDGPIQEPGVLSIAHLDAAKCQLTGDPDYPVIFHNPKSNNAHRLHATRVAHASDLTSPNEDMRGVGFCATSRVVASSEVLLKLQRYKNEKMDDLPQAGLLILNNVLPTQWADVTARHELGRRKLNQELWNNVMTLFSLDPQKPATADFTSFASLPDHFNEETQVNTYVNIVALAFGVDTREFWPISGQPLGTATETAIQHQKARGKGVGDIISTLERIVNWKVLPPGVTFAFEFRQDEEDQLKAETIQTITKTIMMMWEPRAGFGGVDEQPPVARDEIRQMLADNVPYFKESFLTVDVTPETEVTDTERRGYGRRVRMDNKGRYYEVGRKMRHIDPILDMVEDNYRRGLVDAEQLAEYAVGELLDRRRHGGN